jgi:hypothetical protein
MAETHQKVGSILPGYCPSYLELQSVTPGTLKQYLDGLGLAFASPDFCLTQASQSETETKLVEWMYSQCYKGDGPNTGEKVLAALMALLPQYSRSGSMHIPRVFRTLAGWRRLVPHRSKKLQPWAVWTAIAVEMCREGELRAAIGVLL